MKFNMKLLAAALAMAAAGQASAAITLGNAQGGSSLFLSVWDSTTNESYTRNLGVNLNGFLPSSITTLPNDGNVAGTSVTGDKTPAAGISNLAFAGDALFASTFGDNNAANIQWNIVAFDNQASLGGGLSRVITTANGTPGTTNTGIGTIGSGATAYLTAVNGLIGAANSVVVTDPGSAAFAGADTWGDALNLALNGSSAGTGFGSTLDFFYLARTQVSGVGSTAATNVQFGNSSANATWTLSANGTATYNLAGEAPPSAVPVPAAAWLLGSGLAGLVGAARRRKAAAV
ncbi:MAG: VPLPA-CTERM sorting domain-containing protein [Burkholderiaceae bacterium]|nr:VPLPA-CTERM sorting domain-containing protein [Burkholderiaceae bacterium]